MASDVMLQVTVVYSPRLRVVHEQLLQLDACSTVLQALQASGFLQRFPLIDTTDLLLGVWGRKAATTQTLRDNDRIEIYRQLRVDPKVSRRERFIKQGARAAGLFNYKRAGAKAGY
ncbi:MAG: putative ubiquitin-RnfH superfamily antitoxin RatB of RatAB toxin-antitoxin module [Rhodoferax sp.]|jgi:putative ubiquitin-RnfH superfamily antitoxin RatB of RatAB toxin-antitoxin module